MKSIKQLVLLWKIRHISNSIERSGYVNFGLIDLDIIYEDLSKLL